MKLSEAQNNMLALHVGTTRNKPRRRTWGPNTTADDRKEIHFPTNPTAMSLRARGLLDYRGFDGTSPGGWFITEIGRGVLAGSLQPL